MLEHSTTVRAETVDKAIEKGLRELNISRSEADVHIITEGKKGIFGFGKQDAVVEITLNNKLSLSELTEQLEEGVKNQQVEAVKLTDEVVEVSKELELEEVEADQAEEVVEVVENEQTADTDTQINQAELEENPEETSDRQEETFEEVTEKNDQEDDLTIQEASQKVATYIEDIIKDYGAEAGVTYEIKQSQVTFNIDTDKSGLVIGKHGKVINSLQILSQTYFQGLYRRRTSILLNVGDYRDRRANVLQQIAQRTAEEVLKTKQAVILDPLPAYERKQIHAHLARVKNIRTHSEGKEPNRYLVVEYRD